MILWLFPYSDIFMMNQILIFNSSWYMCIIWSFLVTIVQTFAGYRDCSHSRPHLVFPDIVQDWGRLPGSSESNTVRTVFACPSTGECRVSTETSNVRGTGDLTMPSRRGARRSVEWVGMWSVRRKPGMRLKVFNGRDRAKLFCTIIDCSVSFDKWLFKNSNWQRSQRRLCS